MDTAAKIALIPAYEPTETLTEVTQNVAADGFEVIVIDDGSGPDYADIFEAAGGYATVLRHDVNKGKGQALKTALEYIRDNIAGESIIVTLDADGQHRPEDVARVYEAAVQKPDSLILGSRSFVGDVPARSRFGNTVTRYVYRISTGTRVHDTQTGLRAFGSRLIPFMLEVEGERYEYEMNVLLKCSRGRIPIEEVEIATVYIDDNSGSHFDTFRDSLRVYKNILKFAASSMIGFVVDYGMYALMILLTNGLGTAVSVPVSNVTARIISAGTNFAINKRFVFENKDSLARTGVKYFALAACILCFNTVLLSFLVERVGINRFVAKLFTEVTFFTLSWFAQKFIVFKKEKQD